MTEVEIKENLKAKCRTSWETYQSYENIFGNESIWTQKKLTEWTTYLQLYEEFFGELLLH